MKVRWVGASLRLRITPSELADLVLGEPVSAELPLPAQARWSVTLQPGGPATGLAVDGAAVTVRLASADVNLLAAGDTEGVYFWSDGAPPIRYYVEKDFPCQHPHPVEACEPETERFAPTPGFLARKHGTLAEAQ